MKPISTHSKTMSDLLEISENSYFRWKKKDHVKLIKLLEKYFEKEQLEEFLEKGKIKKFEQINQIEDLEEFLASEKIYVSKKYINETILLKLSKLNIRERAILFHVLEANKDIKTKEELITRISTFDLLNLVKEQLKKTFENLLKFKIFHKFTDEDRAGYPHDRTNLRRTIEDMYEFEIEAWLQEPDFSF